MPTVLPRLKRKISREAKLKNPIFSYPPNSSLGDLSLACFDLAKKTKIAPNIYAQELADKLNGRRQLKKYFSEIKPVGPYLNFYINLEYLAQYTIQNIKASGKKYGNNKSGGKQKIVLEYSNGNTHKEYHVGHLRNISYGDSIARLLAASSYNVVSVSYINDFGIHVAKTIWNWRNNPQYEKAEGSKGYLLGSCYSESARRLEEEPEKKEEVLSIMKEIESRQGENYRLWEKTRLWSIKYFASIYKDLGISFSHIFYENEYIDEGLRIVKRLLKRKKLVESEGAIIADLTEYNLGVLPVMRQGGTALYPVADLALIAEKNRRYQPDESFYVVDVRQGLYLKQLDKLREFLGYKSPIRHLGYDFVTLPEGMMSSRSGNVITYQDLKEKIFTKLVIETAKRHSDWTKTRINQVAWSLTVSTIKFEMLKVSADKIIVFNIDEALRFDGYTACYLQYGYVRLKSLIRKEPLNFIFRKFSPKMLSDNKEKELLLKLARYPEIIKLAGDKYNPSELAKYLFELIQMFNDYYHEVNILRAEPKLKKARLVLARAIAQTLNNGFKILGLKVIEEM